MQVLAALLVGERARHVLAGDPEKVVDVERPDPRDATAHGREHRAVRAEGDLAAFLVPVKDEYLLARAGARADLAPPDGCSLDSGSGAYVMNMETGARTLIAVGQPIDWWTTARC